MGTSSKQQRSTKKSRNAKKAPAATSPTISLVKSTTSTKAMASKRHLLEKLDVLILSNALVDLHTHLMGMGNADFWVTKIIEGYLPRAKSNVTYDFCKICEASNLTLGSLEKSLDWQRALVESRLFDGSALTLLDIPDFDADDPSLPNEFLVTMLQEEDSRYPNRDGPLRSLVRNWFEFLDSNGNYPDQNAILDTYRGKFTPMFSARFIMRDVIIGQESSVLSVLTNHVLGIYATAGANYVEFSVSVKDIMDDNKRKLMTTDVFSSEYFRRSSSSASRRGSLGATSTAATVEPAPIAFLMDTDDRSTQLDSEYRPSESASLERGDTVLNDSGVSRIATTSRPSDSTLPPLRKGTRLKPSWRMSYSEYNAKNDNQMWKFLAAFPRTRGVLLPQWATDGDAAVVFRASDPHRPPISTLADLAGNLDRLSTWYRATHNVTTPDDVSHETMLERLAEFLCSDEVVNQIFPDNSDSGNRSCFDLMREFTAKYCNNTADGEGSDQQQARASQELRQCVVGIDCVGDEFGHPFCMFAHLTFLTLINACRASQPHFGVRVHAGEGLMRHSTIDEVRYSEGHPLTAPHAAFMLHVFILIKSIAKLIAEVNWTANGENRVSIRIGHGVAFLYQPKRDGPFKEALRAFRALLIEHDIVCELNPTSNHMLLQHSFTDGSHGHHGVKNIRTLRSFFELDLPVILCTDDDGIWDIRKCAKHGVHVSVARELCDAIEHGDILTEEELKRVTGRRYAFTRDV